MLCFLCGLFVLYTIDRAMLGLLAVPIQQETGLSDVKFGVLSAAIFWTYAVCVPFSGLAGDRFDRAKLIGIASIAWSAMTFLAGFANGFWSLFLLVSVAIAAPQTLYGPSANALLAEQHKDTRTIALSCHQAAYYVGWFVSGASVAAVTALCGSWRGSFFAFGSLGLLPRASRPQNFSASLRAFFGCRTAVLAAVCYVAEVFVGYGYSAWGPKFVAQKFSITAAQAGTGVMFWHYVSAFAAILVAGFATDRFVRRMPRFRLALSAGALGVSMPTLALFGMSSSLWVVWGAAAMLGAMIGVVGANQFAAVFDVVPSQYRAGSVGFLNVIAGLVGSTAPIALGALSEKMGVRGFEIGFASMAGVQLVAAAALVLAMAFTFRRDYAAIEQ